LPTLIPPPCLVRRILGTLAVVAAALSIAGPASAATTPNGPSDCSAATLVGTSVSFTEPTGDELPAELRSLSYDCAFDVDGAADEVANGFRSRVLVFQNPSVDEVTTTIRLLADSPSWSFSSAAFVDQSAADLRLDEILAFETLDADFVAFFSRALGDGYSTQNVNIRYVDSATTTSTSFGYYVQGFEDEGLSLDPALGDLLTIDITTIGDLSPSGFAADTPSVLSSLTTVAEAATPARVGFAAGGAVVLGVLLTFPSRLLSGAKDRILARVMPRIVEWWARVRRERLGWADRAPRTPAAETRPYAGWPLALAALAVASVLTVFIDPRAGLNPGTLRVFGSVFIAFVVDVGLGWVGLILLVSRLVPTAVARFQVKPWSLVMVVAAVLFSRIAQFEPGLTVGLVAGVVYGGALAQAQKTRLTLGVMGYGFVLSIVAWVAYSLLADGGDAWLVFLRETFAAITVAGIVALPLALLPVRGLAGYEIFAGNRRIWAIAYGLGLAAFLLVIVPLPSSWELMPVSFVAWIALFVLYVVVAVVVWLLVVKPWAPETADDELRRTSEDVAPPTR
jgi:hypothetical protein